MRNTVLFCAAIAAATVSAADFPEAEISTKTVTAKFYLPDAEKGYYRGTRFDWSGQIPSLKAGGHEYFGQWFPKYDPKLHDSIMGPVEDFRSADGSLGFSDAKPGGTFIRIGVGVVRRPDEKPFDPFRTYDIVDPGKWTIKRGRGRITFTQELKDESGYAYRYTKTIRLSKDKPEMVIEHALKNTGSKPIRAQQYNHNFFVMDNAPTGPDTVVEFPFELKPVQPMRGKGAAPEGRNIVYNKELQTGESVYGEFAGFGNTAADYNFRLENKKAGAGVRIVGDQPLAKLVYWSIRTTFCPEAYINIQADPAREFRWKYTYTFYRLAK